VCASERLQAWYTPHTISFLSSVRDEIPAETMSILFQSILLSLDENTRSDYGAGLLHFTQFCNTIAISKHMPTSSILLSVFAASGMSKVSQSCVDSWMAGIPFWHVFNGAMWNGDSCEMLSKVKVGVSRMAPASAKRPKHPLVTVEHMYALYRGLDLTNAFDSAIFGICMRDYSILLLHSPRGTADP
jgi:hypothetical protein